MELAAAFEEL
jgi:hypothetical protein